MLDVSTASERGPRAQNEDAFTADERLGLFAVADGIGGERGGAIASSLAIGALEGFFRRARAREPELVQQQLQVAVRLAHRRVIDSAVGPYARMGTTVAAIVVCGDHVVRAHVGDSRVYRVRDRQLELLTLDHSMRAQLAVAPNTRVPFMDALTRALTPRCDARPDIAITELTRGDALLVCTDGVYRALGDAHICRVLAGPWQDPAHVLVRAALAAGGRDNATAIVVRAQ
jgi:serine/threonine protein phosphatase PrpC